MKQSFFLTLFLLIVMLLSPLLVFIPEKEETPPEPGGGSLVSDNTFTEEKVTVLLTKTGEKITVSAEEYLIGSVAREMLPTYNAEALKAQAAVCRTYIEKMKKQEKTAPTPELKGADVSDDSSVHQGYMTQKERREKFGNQFEAYEKKLREAVEIGGQYVITYNGEIITAAYCAVSSGQTESADVIWGGDLPYLKPVQSAGDRLSPGFASTVTLTEEEFKSKAKLLDGAVLGENPDGWIGKSEISDSGTVIKINIGEKEFSGLKVRDAFGLRSPVFTVKHEKGKFVFSVFGYGHGVGMSQYGADYMARQGASWQEIIKHYYTGVEIEKRAF